MGNVGPVHSPHLVRMGFQKHSTLCPCTGPSRPSLALTPTLSYSCMSHLVLQWLDRNLAVARGRKPA